MAKMARTVQCSLGSRDDKARREEAIRLGMNIILAVGWEKCQDWAVIPVSKIEEEAGCVHRKVVLTRQATAVEMGLCESGLGPG